MTYVGRAHIATASLDFAIHRIDFTEPRRPIRNRRVDSALRIQSFKSSLLSLHVQGVIHLVVDAEFFVQTSGAIAFESREHRCLVHVELLQGHFVHWIALVPRVVSDDIVLCTQVVPFDTPAVLTRHASHRIDNSGLIIDSAFLGAHLILQETSERGLVLAILRVFQNFLLSLIQSFFVGFV